jgi:serine/threonine protein kinase
MYQVRQEIFEGCASVLRYKPALYGFEELPGDWCMVVMEEIDPHIYRPYDDIRLTFSEQQRQHLRHEFLGCIRTLHNAEMVHGDIRDVNLLVRVDGTFGFKILDFDWAGRIGVVRYPINVNHDGISRPVTASDGELVTVEHDLAMVDFMISSAG